MELKDRESTLEVLRRLQAKNKKPIPSIYEKPPFKLRVEDILGGDAPEPKSVSKIKLTGKNAEAVYIINGIKEIERQLKTGASYFDHYYDLRKKEDELVKIYDSLKENETLSDEVLKRVKEIKRRFNK